ncbi:hypothetical protein D3C81_1335970 [compost metagenome]
MTAIGAERRDRVCHVGTHCVQGMDLATRVVTHLTVAFFRPLTQFADIPEHQDGAAGKAGEYINGRAHRGGICVVTVIDDPHTVRRKLRHGTALDRLHGIQASGNTTQAQTDGMRSGGSGQRVADVVGTQHIQLHRDRAIRAMQGERRATTGIATDFAGVEICLRVA